VTSHTRVVVVVAYGAPTLLSETLADLSATEQVIVVDNSSREDIRAAAEAAGARYLDPRENRGFAAGVNAALRDLRQRQVSADVLLLNPDARLSTADIDKLQAVFTLPGNERVAAVAPQLASSTGAQQRVMWHFPTPAAMWREAVGLGRWNRSQEQFAVGAVLLLRREALEDVGHFDERYFLYAEEADWQRRAMSSGWRSIAVEEVTALHIGGATSTDSARQQALFHAGQETYIRRWFGPAGWVSYRCAAMLGAIVRAMVTTGPRRRQAWLRAELYLRGPRRSAGLAEPRIPARITHLVVTDNSAGTERYVSEVAGRQADNGHQVTVIGGDKTHMRAALPASVTWRPGGTVRRAAQSLLTGGSQDIMHTHLTAADLVGAATAAWHGGQVVSTRHIAKPRGTTLAARIVSGLVRGRIAAEIAISEHVREAIEVPATVVYNGVRNDERHPASDSKIVLIAQRLEPEKATDVALAGWAASGLASQGWTLVVCGDGAQLQSLRRHQSDHGIAGVEWRGWVEDIRTAMLDAAVLLAPAPGEPFGLTVVEAMSVGLPVVASAAGGHLETLGACPRALLFAPDDPESCAQKLVAFARMPAAARVAYGEELRQLQRRQFDLADHVLRLDEIYIEALGGKCDRQ
jgi:GT2 family glycosyltransferase/glycosyltransferase involved in cell wall biosynthesis